MREIVFSMTADEACRYAFLHSEEISSPVPGAPEFELQMMAQSIRNLRLVCAFDSGFNSDSAFTIDVPKKIVSTVRRYFVRGAALAQLASASAEIARIILHHLPIESQDANLKKSVTLAALQIASSLFSIMKRNPDPEALQAAVSLCADNYDVSDADDSILIKLHEIFAIFVPCTNKKYANWRCAEVGAAEPYALLSDCSSDELAECLCASRFAFPAAGSAGFAGFASHFSGLENMSANEAASLLMDTVSFAPYAWICRQMSVLPPSWLHIIYMILQNQTAHCENDFPDEPSFPAWIAAQMRDTDAVMHWLLRRTGAGAANAGLHALISVMKRHETGDPAWAESYLRSTEHAQCTFWPAPINEWCASLHDLEVFWHAAAWIDRKMPQRAFDMLEQEMAMGNVHPVLWLMMAQAAVDCDNLGAAEQALMQAEICVPQSVIFPIDALLCGKSTQNTLRLSQERWNTQIEIVSENLAKAALHTAMVSAVTEPSRLELAMRFGRTETASQAALCWYDGRLGDSETLYAALAERQPMRERFISQILTRRDAENTDELYRFCSALRERTGDIPEILVLEAASQLEEPEAALQTAQRALRRLAPSGILYWDVLDFVIEILCGRQGYDEAVQTAVPAIETGDARAMRALMFIMASMPHEFLPVMKTILVENLGEESTRSIFNKMRSPNQNQTNTNIIHLDNLSFDELSSYMLPIVWQIFRHSARLVPNNSDAEREKSLRRSSVLMARGAEAKKFQEPPETAVWVHMAQPHASDAFRNHE